METLQMEATWAGSILTASIESPAADPKKRNAVHSVCTGAGVADYKAISSGINACRAEGLYRFKGKFTSTND